MSDGDAPLPPKAMAGLKRWIREMLGYAVTRWGIGIVMILVAGYAAYDDVTDDVAAAKTKIEKLDKRTISTSARVSSIELRLADGTGPATVQDQQRRIQLLEEFVSDQRTLNGALTTQSQNTADAVKDVKNDVNALKNEVGQVKGGVEQVLRLLRQPNAP